MSASNSIKNNSSDKSKFYNASLMLLRGRKLSIIAQKPNLNEESTISDDVNIEDIEETVLSLHSFVSHLITVRKSFETIINNINFLTSKNNLPSNIVQTISELTYVTKHILSYQNVDDKELYAAKLSHGKSLGIYRNQLSHVLNSTAFQKTEDDHLKRKLAAVAKMLKKLNAARIVKRSLIGSFGFDPYNRHNMRSSCRRNFTMEDFLQ